MGQQAFEGWTDRMSEAFQRIDLEGILADGEAAMAELIREVGAPGSPLGAVIEIAFPVRQRATALA